MPAPLAPARLAAAGVEVSGSPLPLGPDEAGLADRPATAGPVAANGAAGTNGSAAAKNPAGGNGPAAASRAGANGAGTGAEPPAGVESGGR